LIFDFLERCDENDTGCAFFSHPYLVCIFSGKILKV
jgi:hypothetical protein